MLRIEKPTEAAMISRVRFRNSQATLCFVDAQILHKLRRRTAEHTFERRLKWLGDMHALRASA